MNVNGTDVATDTVTLTITNTVDTVEHIDQLVSKLPRLLDVFVTLL